MNLFQKIKNDYQEARKNKLNLHLVIYRVLIGELEQKAILVDGQKVVNDEVTISTIKKFIQNNTEYPHDQADFENSILKQYLPKPLTSSDIHTIVYHQIASGASISDIMNYFKVNYAGRFDGKTVVTIVKEAI